MNSILIIGAGRFGIKAAKKLSKQYGQSAVTILDKNQEVCRTLEADAFKAVCTEGIRWLCEHPDAVDHADWVVPCIPVHVAYEWIKCRLKQTDYWLQPLTVPLELATQLPNAFAGPNGQLYVSNADFLCPENCPEPDDICTYTGKPRPRILHQTLRDLKYPHHTSVVIRSRQLAPGVGGYPPGDLHRALGQVLQAKGPILLSTACSCHGVMHAFEILAS